MWFVFKIFLNGRTNLRDWGNPTSNTAEGLLDDLTTIEIGNACNTYKTYQHFFPKRGYLNYNA